MVPCEWLRRLALPLWLTCLISSLPIPAYAHVKWFCAPADVTAPPVALAEVLTPTFLLVCGGFLVLTLVGYTLDGAIASRWPRMASSGQSHALIEEKLVRLATGAFFLLLWDKGAVVLWERGGVILTPELDASAWWMGVVQFAVAVSVAWRPTCIIGAIGIVVLYVYGIVMFGMFHMIDYVFFPGLAAYLALTSIATPTALRWRVSLLTGGLAFSLMWTAVEKFLYPSWTLYVIAEHPDISAGFPGPFVVVVAGFVEFTLSFYIMLGRGLVRFGAAAFAAIFLVAIPEFGHLDAVGHIPIVAILAVVCLHGSSPLQRLLGLIQRSLAARSIAIAALYVGVLVGMVGLYYGTQWAEYGGAAGRTATAAAG